MNWGEFGWTTILKGKQVIVSYFITSALGTDEKLFQLSGSAFTYDGDTIWRVVMQDGLVMDYEPSANTDGLQFCGASSASAYFWSTIDEVLYTYNGDTTLTAFARISGKGALRYATYCQSDDTLSLCFEHEYICLRHSLWSTYDLKVEGVTATVLGAVVKVNGRWHTMRPAENGNLPVVIETNILGDKDDLMTNDVTRIGLRVKGAPASCKVFNTLYNRNVTQEEVLIPRFTKDSISVFSFTPKLTNTLGLVSRIECNTPVYVLELQTNNKARVANPGVAKTSL
ncbi:hypothetical protein FACS1894172_09230 [Spirochaetia bacterium]|nr:hypothetical protein FACS1894172_09230 [Spirochaetia bacterium]